MVKYTLMGAYRMLSRPLRGTRSGDIVCGRTQRVGVDKGPDITTDANMLFIKSSVRHFATQSATFPATRHSFSSYTRDKKFPATWNPKLQHKAHH
jgi:hypothetical protein